MRRHSVEKHLPSFARHCANAVGLGVFRLQHGAAPHLLNGLLDNLRCHVGVCGENELIARRWVAVNIRAPAFDCRIDESLHMLRAIFDPVIARQHHGGITRIAVIGQEKNLRFEPAARFNGVGLGGDITLLDGLLVDQKRREVESIFADLAVGKPIFGAQPDPEGVNRRVGDHDWLAHHILKRVYIIARMRDQHLRVFLERRHNSLGRHTRFHNIERNEAV